MDFHKRGLRAVPPSHRSLQRQQEQRHCVSWKTVPLELGPSLLLEHCEDRTQLRKLLQASTSRETQVISKGRLLHLFCPKVFCLEEPLTATFPAWPAVMIPLPTAQPPLPMLDRQTQKNIADEFQPKLLMYRLKNYDLVASSGFDIPELRAHSRDTARCLGACAGGDKKLQVVGRYAASGAGQTDASRG